MTKKKVGRPKIDKPKTKLDLSSFQSDITVYKNILKDALEDDEYEDHKDTIEEFLKLPTDVQNIFIVYLLKNIKIKELATLLNCDRKEICGIITKTKKILRK